MLELLKTLVSQPTVTGDKLATVLALDDIEVFLASRGMKTKQFEAGGFSSLLAATKSIKNPAVLLNAHIDIVPAPEHQFELRRVKDRLYGRGVYDMKFAIAAYLQLVDDLQDRLKEYDFGIMITSDEEQGGFYGAGKLAAAGYRPTKVCITPDGGEDWAIETFAKGAWQARISMPGKSAHSSRPWEGENAIDQLIALLQEVKDLVPEPNPKLFSSTIIVSAIHAGLAINQIPPEASADIDLRSASLAEHEQLKKRVAQLCRAHGATLTPIAEGLPCINKLNNPHIRLFAEILAEVTGSPIKTTSSLAATDARYFSALGVPCVIVRPPGGGHHGNDEWISTEGLSQLREILRRYLEKTACKRLSGNDVAKAPANQLENSTAG